MGNKIPKKTMYLIFKDYMDFNSDNHLGWDKFTELCNKKYGLSFGTSAYRKPIKYYLDAKEIWTNDKENREVAIENKELKLIAKQKELTRINTIVNKAKNELANVYDLRNLLENLVEPSTTYIPKIETEKSNSSNLFVLSDIQIDGNGWSKEVYQFCLDNILKVVKEENLKEIWVIDNGDIIDSNLRVSSLIENKPFVSQLIEAQQNLSSFLEELTKHVKVNFSIVNSNHLEMRLFGFKAGETKQFDITIILLEYLKCYLRNNKNINFLNNVKNAEDLNYNIIEVEGYNIFTQHGDMKGININNHSQTFSNVRNYIDEDIDYCVFGHRHNQQFQTVSMNKKKGGNKAIIWVGALDIRMKKENEVSAMLSSTPSFVRIKLEKGNGITNVQTFNVPKILWR